MDRIVKLISEELGKKEEHVANVIKLMDEGNTIPFIARYRKEAHGAMDDTSLRKLEERLTYLRRLEERRAEILKAVEALGKLTLELEKDINKAEMLSELEDLYRPYKQKRRTRATIAREKGLEPLAARIFTQEKELPKLKDLAEAFTDNITGNANGVETIEDALTGAADIIAENISDNAEIRKKLKALAMKLGMLTAEAATDEDSVYRQYYEFSQPLKKAQGHQILAVNRGEKEKFLKVKIELDHDQALVTVLREVLKKGSSATEFVGAAALDSLDRLIWPSVERELRAALTDTACEGAIHNFSLNLKPLLMQPPVKGHVTMGLDPGYRMGCKVAVIDGTGKVLDTTVVYPTHGDRKKAECIEILGKMIKKHGVEHIAIGNGTASRETESMAAELIASLNNEGKYKEISYAIVNEAGASVYSASKLAAEEFPQFDVNLRSAVSIARRLQDPLAELVKIDPKAIGVGQYQHDMPEKELDAALSGVVEDCVNAVGVDINTASPSLLSYVSGLNGTTAKNIVIYRDENGEFTSRSQLKKVPKLGPKAFEQCAGFLRVPESKEPLDNTGVHPESYKAAEALMKLLGISKAKLIGSGNAENADEIVNAVNAGSGADLSALAEAYGIEKLAVELGIGVPTLKDIIKELMKPGRDPREDLPPAVLRKDVLDVKDLKPGMKLKGTVRNVIDFGVFVDIGVHQDGLVHISEICDKYIKHPSEVLKVGDIVEVIVLSVDEARNRISLSIKQA
ncbi:MAG: RNA-binding transcriptional accessory protein [Lachnospiraceae bacterium]|nr:RNA-binding transcriptional accessory protein [Lachnospiraceae bacterium]